MTRLAPFCLASLLTLSCGGSDSSGTPDAPPTPIIDATPTADVSGPTPDAPLGAPDATPTSDGATTVDATTAGDGGSACNGVGEPCTTTCPAGLNCYGSGAGGVCAPLRDGCGGFAGATCDDPAFPICMELTSTDYGLCVDARERDCICAGAPSTVDKC